MSKTLDTLLSYPKTYVLVTPAKNEAVFLPDLIESICNQTIKPVAWVIVDDGSTDQTSNIVESYLPLHTFIKLIKRESDKNMGFASKALSFNCGYNYLSKMNFKYVGNIDADITFDSDYFETLIERFEHDSLLGLAGGQILELQNGIYKSRFFSNDSVAGAVQFFRHDAFKEFGEYPKLKYGGIDTAAEIFTEMNGWKVVTFDDLHVKHHRVVGTSKNTILRSKYRYGSKEKYLKTSLIYFLFKCFYRIFERPFFTGSVFMFFGYTMASFRKENYDLPNQFFKFRRDKQKRKLLSYLPF